MIDIGEEACGTCDGIVKTIADSMNAIESTISDIDPALTKNAIYKDLVTGIDSVLEIASNSCPSSTVFMHLYDKDCLTPKQDEQLEEIVHHLAQLFKVVVVSLDVAAAAVPDSSVSRNLYEASKIIDSINKDVIENKLVDLTKVRMT